MWEPLSRCSCWRYSLTGWYVNNKCFNHRYMVFSWLLAIMFTFIQQWSFFFWLWNLSSCDVGTSISTLRWRKRCACMKEAVYCMLSLSHKEHRPLSFPLQYSLCKIVFRTKNKSWKTICSCHGQRIFHAALVSESQFLVIHVSKIYKDFDTWLRQCYRVLSTFLVFVCVSSISCCSSLSYTLSFLSVYLPNPCGLKPQWSCQCLKKQDTLGLSFY
jgi:hypothetical protein